jgi:hypothetical protein
MPDQMFDNVVSDSCKQDSRHDDDVLVDFTYFFMQTASCQRVWLLFQSTLILLGVNLAPNGKVDDWCVENKNVH